VAAGRVNIARDFDQTHPRRRNRQLEPLLANEFVVQTTPGLTSLIPHQGAMCLLERVVDWDARRITLEATTHRSLSNPLRRNDRLRAIHLCEYGAQAMAVHGALKSRAAGGKPAPGMLVSLRSVTLTCDYIDALPGPLAVEAECLQASSTSLQYAFRITHAGELLAEGRAAVVLSGPDMRG
jgi:predicted hotdog family 3-hydroxylacyl-ACP dehydratase